MRKLYYLLILWLPVTSVKAQDLPDYEDLKDSRKHNPNSLRPIRDEDVMYSIRVTSRMDLREKINRAWDSEKSKIMELIFEGVDAWYAEFAQSAESSTADEVGIRPFSPLTDGFLEADLMPEEDYNGNVTDPKTQSSRDLSEDEIADLASDMRLSNPDITQAEIDQAVQDENNERRTGERFAPGALKTLEIEEDLIFDRNHSTSKWDIQTVTVVATVDILGEGQVTDREVVRVRFKDLVRYLRKVYAESDQEKAFLFNPGNPGKKEISFADAFDMRLFNAWIIKYSNIGGLGLQEILGNPNTPEGRLSILELSQKFRNKLLEKQHNLWEY